jgi:hypothetical protein
LNEWTNGRMGYVCGDGDYDSLRSTGSYSTRTESESNGKHIIILRPPPVSGGNAGRQAKAFPPSRRVSDWPNRDGARFIESSAAGIGHRRDKQRLAVAATPNRRGVPGFERLQENTYLA